jgi:two-component system, NtrC family, sensor histidine kinase HydH
MKLGEMRLLSGWSRANLTTRFGVYSFVCIGIMTATLWLIVSNYLVSGILRREWETTAQFIRTEVKEFLTTEDFTTKDRKSVGHKFEELLRHITLMPDIVRFKVYNPQGVVIWSDDKRLVGKSFANKNELQKAIRGEVVADLSSLTKTDNNPQDNRPQRAVQVYIPIYWENSGGLLGVMEIYKNAEAIYRDVHEARLVVLIGALGGGLLLYLSLFAIVRQAAQKIRQQQENLTAVQSELVSSQRMAAIGEMAAAVAHGIGNPLSSIRAAAQVAKLDCADSSGRSKQGRTETALQSIIEQVDRVQKRMHALLNFAKPMEPRPGWVELNTVVTDILAVLKPRFAEAGVSPQLDLDRSLPKLRADPNHMEQILMGLITNALEATPPGGRVNIATRTHVNNGSPPLVSVTIEDTGNGIPPEVRDRLFEPFFTTKPHGSGIGLPLAKKFVERNGGRITLSDRVGGGASFHVTFQAQSDVTTTTAALPQDALRQPQGQSRDARAPHNPTLG